MIEVKCVGSCTYCGKQIEMDEDNFEIHCQNCILHIVHNCIINIPIAEIKCIMEEIIKHRAWDNDNDYPFFKDDLEKKAFMLGIKVGIKHVVFSYLDKYGDEGIRVFESLEHLFNSKKVME